MNASWIKDTGEYTDTIRQIEKCDDRHTIVTMSNFLGNEKEQEFYSRYIKSVDELKKDVIKNFLLRLWLASQHNSLSLEIKTQKRIIDTLEINIVTTPS